MSDISEDIATFDVDGFGDSNAPVWAVRRLSNLRAVSNRSVSTHQAAYVRAKRAANANGTGNDCPPGL